jgi:hypothetical protein
VSLAIVPVVALGGWIAWRWYNTASDLIAYSGVNQTASFRTGQTFYVGSDIQPDTAHGHRRLDVHRVSPRVTLNTAHAVVEVMLCRVADPHQGLLAGPDTKPCASVTNFRSGSIDLGFPTVEIIYKITSTTPGAVRIEGARVSYSDGTRRGIQHAGSGTALTVTS